MHFTEGKFGEYNFFKMELFLWVIYNGLYMRKLYYEEYVFKLSRVVSGFNFVIIGSSGIYIYISHVWKIEYLSYKLLSRPTGNRS